MNQSQSYVAEREGRFLWAPKRNKTGRTFPHWHRMSMVRRGDVVIHYANLAIRAVSRATSHASDAPRPDALPDDLWEQHGWKLPVDMYELATPIRRDDIPIDMRADKVQKMFTTAGTVNQGYLYPVDVDWFNRFAQLFRTQLPEQVLTEASTVPAEVANGAEVLLRSLIGQELRTISGRPNTILKVEGGNALVATNRSTEGQSVPVADVQRALDLLADKGAVTCQPEVVGYRSAFIGAVLSNLPGTVTSDNPPTIALAARSAAPVAGSSAAVVPRTPQGDLDKEVIKTTRTEQLALRRTLVGNAKLARCALCGEEMPVDLLVAAHIKQRSIASDDERRDLLNIGMLACKLGCDDLYELGYISVDDSGTIITVEADPDRHGKHLAALIDQLRGKRCSAFSEANQEYYRWHRVNKFRHT